MCGRFTQAYTWQDLCEFYDLAGAPQDLPPNYNAAPAQTLNVLYPDGDGLHLAEMRWGLVPTWWPKTLDDLPSTFNARSETADEKPMFKSAFEGHRCLVPASGFFAWRKTGSGRQPHYISMADGSLMTFAGLWARWHDTRIGKDLLSFTILTTTSNELVAKIHNRMPVILTRGKFDWWLNDGDPSVLIPCHYDLVAAHPVGKAVENVRNNGPELLDHVATET